MKTDPFRMLLSCCSRSALAAALAGIFVSSAFGTTSTFTDADVNDSNWATAGNWDNGVPGTNDGIQDSAILNLGAGEALINSAVPTISWVEIGVGNDDGALRMTSGGSLTLIGNRFEVGGDAGQQNASFVMEGGSVTATSHADATLWMLGRRAGDTGTSEVTISGGTFTTRGLSMGREATSSGTATLNVTGTGHLDLIGAAGGGNNRQMWLNGIGPSGVDVEVNISGSGKISAGNEVFGGDGGMSGKVEVNVTENAEFDVTNHFHLGTPSARTGGTGQASLLVSDNATVTIGGRLDVGHALATESTVTVTGGSLSVGQNLNLSNKTGNNNSIETTHLLLSGGETSALGVWAGSNNNVGEGHISISDDASFTVGVNGLVFWSGNSSLTVDGSGATISSTGGVNFQGSGNEINFLADAGGFSFIDNTGSLAIGGGTLLNADASGLGVGYYGLIGYTSLTGTFTENVTVDSGLGYIFHYGTFNPNEVGIEIMIPEPSTYALLFGFCVLLGAVIRRRVRR